MVELGLREKYLEVAASVAATEPAGEPAFGHLVSAVKLGRVAQQLGVSRAAMYKLWPTQHDYWVDLATSLLTRDDDDPWIVTSVGGLADRVDRSNPDLFEAARAWFGHVQDRFAADPRLVLRSASLAYPVPDQVSARRAQLERRDRVEATRTVERALVATGRRPVASLAVDDLTLALVMLIDGSAMLSWTAPDVVRLCTPSPGDDAPPWSALGFAVRCVLDELTEPGAMSSPAAGTAETSTPPVGHRWSDPSSTPARDRALRTGAELIETLITDAGRGAGPGHDQGDLLGHVTIDRVGRAAGVSRRHLYDLWSSQAEFRSDLLGHLSRREFVDFFDDFDHAALESVLEVPDPDQLALTIGELVNAERPSTDDQTARARFAFRGQLTDPGVRARMQQNLEQAVAEQARRLDDLAALLGLGPDDGLPSEQTSLLLMIAAGGSERLNRIDPAAARSKLSYRGGRWSLFSIVCQAITSQCIRADRHATTGLDPAAD